MKTDLKKEIPLLLIILIPFFYLAYIWSSLPQTVPIHWNINGDIDNYGDKIMLTWIPIALPLLIYVIMTFLP